MRFNSAKQSVWRKKSKTIKLQMTKNGYPHINLPVDSVREANWSPDAILDVDIDKKGRMILTNIRQ